VIRVGFHKIGGTEWQGGHNYLTNLLRFLLEYEYDKIAPVLFVDPMLTQSELSDFSSISGLEVVASHAFSQRQVNASSLKAVVLGRDKKIKEVLKKHNIDLLFESARFFGWRIGIPVIAWIPDLQHRELPELFGRWAWWKRDLGFRLQIATGRKIMVSSFDAKSACERNYRTDKGQVEVVSFAVPAIDEDISLAGGKLELEYGLTKPFFFMPNQFWKHKNHQLVVKALCLLKQRGIDDVVVVATGNTTDPRNKRHIKQLKSEIEMYNLEKNFRILGMIPYPHVRALLRASRALLNPSLYEGWSTTVEEAKTTGAPMILSDLPVHKEQATDSTVFFKRHSASALAEALSSFGNSWPSDNDNVKEFATTRSKDFAAGFSSLVRSVVVQ